MWTAEMPPTFLEQLKEKIEADLDDYEARINAYEIWLQAWRARMLGYEGYETTPPVLNA